MFSTMTKAEAQMMMGAHIDDQDVETVHFDESNLEAGKDWRGQGAVNAVKNQGRCGSCWAFSATAATEAAHKIASGKLLTLSEQQLVSCNDMSRGCKGGWPANAFKYLETNPQVLESQYPYVA